MSREYDVVIMGGGPGGSTLAAILARHTTLKVGLFEAEIFPREHIGESMNSPLIPVLSYSGVLPKVLQSDCYIGPKPGGFVAWDPGYEDPWCVILNRGMYDENGVLSFAMHLNRSEFDKVLLDHAKDLGVDVHEGTPVIGLERHGDKSRVQLADGSVAECRIFVEASGRTTSITGVKKQFLSDYKNIAIWSHFVGGKPLEEMQGDWNIYRGQTTKIPGFKGEKWVPIGSFACDDGWFWYIPVPKTVMGRRVAAHSVGLVTDPKILSTSPERRYTDMEVFIAKVRQVPLLRELMSEAQPISDKMLTATNYSMLSDRICDFDQKWILLGDSAFFVDPLFSTGVGLSVTNAAAVSFLIDTTLNSSLPEQYKRDMWYDYQQRSRTTALTLSVCLDQWYHGIARKHPDSMYWRSRRGALPDVDLRDKTFYFVGNGETTNLTEYDYTGDRQRWVEALKDLTPSVPSSLHFIKHFWESRSPEVKQMKLKDPVDGFSASNSLRDSLRLRDSKGQELDFETRVCLHPRVEVRASVLLGQFQASRLTAPEFWMDPLRNAHLVESVPPYIECKRFYFSDRPDNVQVPFLDDEENGDAVASLLWDDGLCYGDLKKLIIPNQRSLVGRLHNAGMLVIR
jgi:flavin-dependent dehydrogenase